MMRVLRLVLPIALLALAGCDRLKGGVDQKALDAEAIGYSCRISLKPPEDCIKENDTHSPTSILFGWKEADRDIRENAIDPTMGKPQPLVQQPQQSTPPAAEKTAEKAVEGVPAKAEKPAATAASEKPAAAKGEKPAMVKIEKPAAETAKPDKAATEKPAGQ